eukprot:TRINITY_DN4329_c0_g1_i1.p1 TRINITY_DN4329_c0_g1~~TRINITY_DN4329_c0_g1_i1.p1  ORF type:complete len:280 (-),score=48.95 TRINITY_DN4329_c0_g1_i1:48-860(-)
MALLSQLQNYVPSFYEEEPIPPERLRLLLPHDQDFKFLHTFTEGDIKSITATAKVQDDLSESLNPTTLPADIWANIFSYFNPTTIYSVMSVCSFFHNVTLRDSLWSKLWLSSHKPCALHPLAPSWKMQYKYFSDHILKHGFIDMKSGSLFVSFVEVLLVLSGSDLHIFELPEGQETPIAKRLINGFASTKSMKRVLKIATPSRTIPLQSTILIHQQIQADEEVKRFGFKFPDEEEIWFALPKQQLQRSKNWLKVLYFHSKQLKKDLGLEY